MLIDVTNSVCRVSDYDELAFNTLIRALTATGSKPDYLTGERPVRNLYAFDQTTGQLMFGTGLLPYVVEVSRQHGLTPGYVDSRKLPWAETTYSHARCQFTPWVDQCEIAHKMKAAGRGVLDLATNFGKTYLITFFWHLIDKPSMLVVVPTQALLNQTSEDIAHLSGLDVSDVGRVGDGAAEWRPVTVAVANSAYDWLASHGKFPIDFQCLFVDEGHKGVATMHQAISLACDAFWRFWLSGTAYKKDDVLHEYLITALAGPVIAKVTNMDLVTWNRSDYPIIRFIDNTLDASGLPVDSDFEDQYDLLKKDEGRNRLIAYAMDLAVHKNLTALTFVKHKAHAQEILKYVNVETALVVGAQSSKNEAIKKGLKAGGIRSVIATSAWREGVSIPNIDVLVQATGGKAEHERDQEFGRVLRKSARGHCWYLDFLDKGAKYPRRHARDRLHHMQTHGFPIEVVSPENMATIFDLKVETIPVSTALIHGLGKTG